MAVKSEWTQQIADLYQHLYDPVYLRTHSLAPLFLDGATPDRDERAQRLHRLLQQAIDDLLPLPEVPALARERRRHRLMVLRYREGLDPLAVAEQLAISRRQYYREHDAAIEAIAALLWDRYGPCAGVGEGSEPAVWSEESGQSRLALLRKEAARAAMPEGTAALAEVLEGVHSLLVPVLQRQGMALEVTLAEDLSAVAMDAELLRQLLLGVVGCLCECIRGTRICLSGVAAGSAVELRVLVQVASESLTLPTRLNAQLTRLEELADLSDSTICLADADPGSIGFLLHLPAAHRHTVVAVDDNDDVLQLFKRFLSLDYNVVTATTAEEGLALARKLRPYALTLDLMMPSQDGWALLQTLTNHPETQGIPIVVCSVLRQRELALSLGAAAFLEKPVTQQALLAALEALVQA